MNKLTGKGNYQNYDGHYIPVYPSDPNNPHETVYYPCQPQQKHHYTELVVFNPSQVLPRFLVELQPTLPKTVLLPGSSGSSLHDTNYLVTTLLEYQFIISDQDPAYNLIDQKIVLYGHDNIPLNEKETALCSLIKRVSSTGQQTTNSVMSKKITQLIEQLNTQAHVPLAPPQPTIIVASPKTTLPSVAFGKAAWAKYFGDVGVEPPLPSNIDEILNAQCPFWPDKKVKDTHLLVLIPQTVNRKPFTLSSLDELVQKPLLGSPTKYGYYWDAIKNQYGNNSPSSSYWVLLTKDVIPNSRNKSYDAQKELIAEHSQKALGAYEMPQLLEAATAIFMEHALTGTRLYCDNPRTFTRCQERVSTFPDRLLVVGGFCPAGLGLGHDFGQISPTLGVAGSCSSRQGLSF